MALSAWKTFQFFDISQVKLPDDEITSLFESNEVSCVCSDTDNLYLGDSSGNVYVLSSTLKLQQSFRAHDVGSISHMKRIDGTKLLVTIAQDLPNEPSLKVWALDKPVKKTGLPTCQSSISVQNGRNPFPISAFAALDDLSQLAVGFANGAVTVVRGDLIHDRGAKQRTVFESDEPVTGVEFRDVQVQKLTTLYVSTTNRVLKLVISGKGQGQPARVVEDQGCGAGCMTVDRNTGEIVVGRVDMIYYYNLEGRGNCFAFEGAKTLVDTFRDYVAIVSPPAKSANTTGVARTFGLSKSDDLFNTSTFTLLDGDLRYIAHSESVVSTIRFLFSLGRDLYSVTEEGKLHRYHEKTLAQKLDILYQRNLFTYAINIAQKAGVEANQRNIIYKKYGDYLYSKSEYDSAMEQYLKAVDSTEPSQVIRKFLDTQRIHNLIEYLEQLHDHNKATADHTTLLLNCYAKLKDIDKLEKFIKQPGELKFDLDTAITMCRQGGYFEQAAYLATKHGEHELVVDIMIEDSKAYQTALNYIWRLDPELAYPNLMKYARVLLEQCPDATTKLFVDYYTGQYRPKVDKITPESSTPELGYGAMAANSAASAVQNLTNLMPLPFMNTTSVSSPGTQGNITSTVSDGQVVEGDVAALPELEYPIPKPRTAFSSFADHSGHFIIFLEACLQGRDMDESDKTDIYTTLFEMYLHKSTTQNGIAKEEYEGKATTLLAEKDIPIDPSNVLLLSHLSDFTIGTTLIRERAGLLFDIFRSYTDVNDTVGAIKALRKYGPDEPQLYPAALAYFTSSAQILQEAGPELEVVLKKIDEDGLMAPLQVIQTLSENGVATMGLIRPYLLQTITRERKEITNNLRLTTSYRTETASKRAELAEITNKPVVFQTGRCARCSTPIELPAIHFLCKHSFHARCLDVAPGKEEEAECPVCAQQNSTIRAIRRQQVESRARHDLFRDALERSGKDRFGVISEFFGRGVMSGGET